MNSIKLINTHIKYLHMTLASMLKQACAMSEFHFMYTRK
jgi:hypothetical protein